MAKDRDKKKKKGAEATPPEEIPVPRMWTAYQEEVAPQLAERFGIPNRLALPRLEKIVVSMGVGKALENRKRLDDAMSDLAQVTGQKPKMTHARRSISQFKLRQGQPIGAMVTLRGRRMYEFLDRLLSVVIPRIRDFRGLPISAFDKQGNYSLGLTEQVVFPEIDLDRVEFVQGMNVNLVFRNSNREKSLEYLRLIGLPFRRDQLEAAQQQQAAGA